MKHITTSFFLAGYSISSYLSTRGTDGELFLCFYLFGGITLLYLIILLRSDKITYRDVFVSCWMFGIGSSLTMMIDSHLDEMAGMLYAIIPTMLFCVLLLAMMTLFLKNCFQHHKHTHPISDD
ncbi:MAG TPA: hypothetical protein DCM28_08290 [Phycisphaerales bacterium]|nr:hypothetical protein [Phycisphaerales bacterium]|tara:strand:+ start:1435 stop:1803 length:369 start_codon:yes stop_codon:yes gene_type:complete